MTKKILAAALTSVMTLVLFASCGSNEKKLELKTAEPNFGDDFYVVGFRKGENALCSKIESAIKTLVENGKAKDISEKWFGKNIVVFDKDAGDEADQDGTYKSWEDIKAKGEIVVGLDDTFAPMGFRNESNELVGFDVDMANAVGEILGVKMSLTPIDWKAKETALKEKRVDCLWNGLSRTPEREDEMTLSANYLNNRLVIMGNDADKIKTLEDLKNYKIGIQQASSALEVLQKNPVYETVKNNVTEYKTYDEVINDMKTGRIDVMIVDEVLGNYKASKLAEK